jgi:hypothetical protein
MTPRGIAVLLVATIGLGGAVTFAATRRRCDCCGRSEETRPQTPEATLSAALRARADGDLAALLALCSEAGRRQVAADLAAYSAVLREPSTGPRAVSRVPAPTTEGERDDLRAAIAGDAAAAFRVLSRAAPLVAGVAAEVAPAQVGATQVATTETAPPAAGAPPDRVALEYLAPDGGRRLVSLAREGAAWRVDRFPL